MRLCRLAKTLVRTAGSFTVALGVVGLLVLNTGLPLVQPIALEHGKDKSKPFPCQNRPCGCMSADACMRTCCCFSASERLAWAVEHDLDVPAELVAEAAHEQHTAPESHAEVACCTTHNADSAEHGHCDAIHADHETCDHAGSAIVDDGDSDEWHVVVIVGSFAGKCRGLGPLSALSFAMLPSLATVGYQFDWSITGTVACAEPEANSILTPPQTPPPRA